LEDLIQINDLRVEFSLLGGALEAVKGASFRIRPGTTVALVGESGSGKSVIAQSIMGILPEVGRITGGEILFADPRAGEGITDIAKLPRDSEAMRAIRGGRISMIFQEPMTSLSQFHTIGDQIGEALHLHRDIGEDEGREVVVKMLRLVGFPDPTDALNKYAFELSGGLRQRAMIAMALVCRPALLIADEPTTALDVSIQANILKLIKELQAELGMAVLMITHDLGVVANIAEEVVVLYHGEVMESGTIDDIFRNPTHKYLKALINAVPHFDMKEGERLTPIHEIKRQSGPLMKAKDPWPGGDGKDVTLLRAENLTKTFTTRKQSWFASSGETRVNAVDDVNFEIKRGECLGLVGESGCGKTTVSKILMRAVKPDLGTATFNDRGREVDLFSVPPDEMMALRRKIQMIFQDPQGSLNPRMTVFDIIREPLAIHEIGTARDQAEMVKELMRLVGLDPRFLNRYPHCFSGGQRQRIGLARALALKPDLLICDEPVSALDVSIQAQVLNLFKDLQKELGLTYLFISHNLAVVDYIADRIAVMCRGRIVEMAPREVLFRNPVHHYTRKLIAAVPYPDLDRQLDFSSFKRVGEDDPAYWPEPFALRPDRAEEMYDLGSGHFVLATQGTPRKELAA
jgi:peptide/nickel transport system ATP-binding protein